MSRHLLTETERADFINKRLTNELEKYAGHSINVQVKSETDIKGNPQFTITRVKENLMSRVPPSNTKHSIEPTSSRKISTDAKLDEGLEETFPASDPVSVGHSEHVGGPKKKGKGLVGMMVK